LLAGVYFLIRKKEKAALLLFWWLLAAPLPAATARETPHALRILDSLPIWQIITAYGFYFFIKNLKAKKSFIKNSLLFAVCCLLFLNVLYYLHNYYAHYPTEFSSEWQYGYQEMVQAVSEIEENYDRVIVTKSLGRPYIYFLFYKKYPPEKFWQEARVVKELAGFINVTGFGQYEFRDVSWNQDQKEEKSLFVAIPKDVPQGVEVLRTVRRLNQEPVFILFD